jgi:hypothetical protein
MTYYVTRRNFLPFPFVIFFPPLQLVPGYDPTSFLVDGSSVILTGNGNNLLAS